MKILVGSKNPVKINSVKGAFLHYYNFVDVFGFEVPSGVPDQPVNEDTFLGAQNRAEALRVINDNDNLKADFFVGIEGGIINHFNRWFAFGGMCVIDREGKMSFGSSPQFELPKIVVDELLTGRELGHVMDEIMKKENTKQDLGAIGFFTNGVMDRKDLYVPGLIVALVPFMHEKMFFNHQDKE